MIEKPSYKQAEWIHKRLASTFKETTDDVLDVLFGNITIPADFVFEVKQLALEYNDNRSKYAR